MQLHDLMAKLFELRQVAADQAKDGPSGSGAMARALTAYEWLGDNIEAFVDSLDPEMTEGPAPQTEGMGGDATKMRWFGAWLPNYLAEHDAHIAHCQSDEEREDQRAHSARDITNKARAALTPPETAEAVSASWHADDIAVDRFAVAMKATLAKARAKGKGGWYDETACSRQYLSDELRRHALKPDPVDVANFAMFLHQRGETIAPATDDRERLVEAHVWRTMDSAPLDGKHCILALESGCYILSAQGFYHGGKWITVLEGWAGEPLAWMPNVLLPDELCPERFRRGRAVLATESGHG